MTRLVALLCLLSSTAFVGGPAHAAAEQDPDARVGGSFRFETGLAMSAGSDVSVVGTSGEVEYDVGFNVGAAFGYSFTDLLRAELALNYRRNGVDSVKIGGMRIPSGGNVGVLAAMANAYVDFDLGLPVIPYVGGGIGVARIDFENVFVQEDSATELAYNVMGGVAYRLTDWLLVDGGYRYFATLDAELDDATGGQGPAKAAVGIHELLIGLRWEF